MWTDPQTVLFSTQPGAFPVPFFCPVDKNSFPETRFCIARADPMAPGRATTGAAARHDEGKPELYTRGVNG